MIKWKITNVGELPKVDDLDEFTPFNDNHYNEFVKRNKAMLWYVQMGHASVGYSKKL